MSNQRVLILSASVGTGHTVAASALETAFAAHPDVTVRTQDVFEMTNDTYSKLYADTYQLVAKRMPWLLGLVYDFNDEPFTNEQPIRKLWDMLNAQPVVRFVKDYQPDITICTHFTPAGIIAQLMASEQLNTSLSVVTTDYDFQGMWLSRTFNRYFVARDEGAARLIDLGVPEDHITVSGIPVRSVFGEPVDRAAILGKYELDPDLPLILVSAGAVGGGPASEIVAQIMRMQHPLQCIVVCGKNEQLLREIEALTLPHAANFRVLGFTNDMADLIRVATLFVGKPGGLTASECMAAGTPMVIVTPIPGQEERNADYLLEEGAAVRCNDPTTIGFKISRILSNPEHLERLRMNARRIGRPDAAQVIATTALADRHRPLSFDAHAQRQIASQGNQPVSPRFPWSVDPSVIALYDDERGVYIGAISEAHFRRLRKLPRDLDARPGVIMLSRAQIEALRELEIDAPVLDAIEQRFARNGPFPLRITKLALDALPDPD